VPNSELINRKTLQEKTGRMAILYLIDPNENVAMFESEKMVEYLTATYGGPSEPDLSVQRT
jgi:hypothetical protein